MLRQYVITGTKTFTYYKTVNAKDITEAHLLAHQPTDDPEDDWTCHWDSDYDEETKDNGLMVVSHIEDEGEVEDDDYDPTPQYLYDDTNGEPPVSWQERIDAEYKRCEGEV